MCDRFPRKFDVQTSYKLIFFVNIEFSRATYHTIVPSTEELYCLSSYGKIYQSASEAEFSWTLTVVRVDGI